MTVASFEEGIDSIIEFLVSGILSIDHEIHVYMEDDVIVIRDETDTETDVDQTVSDTLMQLFEDAKTLFIDNEEVIMETVEKFTDAIDFFTVDEDGDLTIAYLVYIHLLQ